MQPTVSLFRLRLYSSMPVLGLLVRSQYLCGLLERRQPELVPSVLHSENAQEEAVHAEQDTAPQKDGELLGSGVGNAGDLERDRDGSEGEDAI
jgi:hypothetical protein